MRIPLKTLWTFTFRLFYHVIPEEEQKETSSRLDYYLRAYDNKYGFTLHPRPL